MSIDRIFECTGAHPGVQMQTKPQCLSGVTPATQADEQEATHRESRLSKDAGGHAKGFLLEGVGF